MDLNSKNSGCACLGSGVVPPLGVVEKEVAVLIALVRWYRRAVGAVVRRFQCSGFIGRPQLGPNQAFASSPTPTCVEEHIATTPGCDLTALRALAHADSRRRELRHAPPRLLTTPTRAEEHLAVKPGCKFSTPDAKARGRCLENPPWNVKKLFAGLKGCARDQTCASWCSKADLEVK